MSTYNLTPAERRAISQAKTRAQSRNTKKKDANFLTKALHTIGDVGANLLTGAAKGIEGIYDMGAGIVGAVGGIFSDDFQDSVKEHIAHDFTMETFGNAWQEGLEHSALKQGGIAENVISGIGQMLPAVLVSVATGGLSTAVSQGLSLATMATSAAGSSTEEAFNDGADYYEGLGYGVASGAVEAATEKLLPGFADDIIGKPALKGVKKAGSEAIEQGAKQGVKRIVRDTATNMVNEGVEEMVSEVTNPLRKTIYKGADALTEYGDAEYWEGVGEAGVVGALTSAGYGATVGNVYNKAKGLNGDINASVEKISELESKKSRMQVEGTLTSEAEARINEGIKANYKQIENVLNKSSDGDRAKYIKNYQLDGKFTSDGVFNEKTVDTAGLDGKYYSASSRGQEQAIIEDINTLSENDGDEISVYSGELSDAAKEGYKKTLQAVNGFNERSGENVGVVFVKSGKNKFNGAKLNGRIYLDVATLENGSWAGTVVHELTHFEEGTKEYEKLVSYLTRDGKLLSEAGNSILGDKSYGFNVDKIKDISKRKKSGEKISKKDYKYYNSYRSEVSARMTEYLLGNEAFIEKIIKGEESVAKKVIDKIKDLKQMFSGSTDAASREQLRRIQKAEKLYLQAARAAGKGRLVRYILGQDDEEDIDNEREVQYNRNDDLYTATDAFYDEVPYADRSAFARSLANKTSGVTKENPKKITIYAKENIYFFYADGYMQGNLLKSVSVNDVENMNDLEDIENEVYSNTETADVWSNATQNEQGRTSRSVHFVTDGENTAADDKLFIEESASDRIGDIRKSLGDNGTVSINEGDSLNSNEKIQYSRGISKDGETYTKEQYNNFGWAREAEAITFNELEDLHSVIKEKRSLRDYPRSLKGEYIVEVNNKPKTTLAVNNVFVFIKGSKNNPEITRVIRAEIYSNTEMEEYRDVVYGREKGDAAAVSIFKVYEIRGVIREYLRANVSDYNRYLQAKRQGARGQGVPQSGGVNGIGSNGTGAYQSNAGSVQSLLKTVKTFTDVAGDEHEIVKLGDKYFIRNNDRGVKFDSIDEVIESKNKRVINKYARILDKTPGYIKNMLEADPHYLVNEILEIEKETALFSVNKSKIQYSRNTNGTDENKITAEMSEEIDYQSSAAYTYNSLIQKSPMNIVLLENEIPIKPNGKMDRSEIIKKGRQNARDYENPNNSDKETYVWVSDISLNVRIHRDGLEHGLDRKGEDTAIATMNIGDLLTNSIAVNELNARVTDKKETEMSYVLLACGRNKTNSFIVRIVIDKNKNTISEISSFGLYAINAKKDGVLFLPKGNEGEETEVSDPYLNSTISIADLFESVKGIEIVNEIFSRDVAEKLGVSRSNGKLSKDIKYSRKTTENQRSESDEKEIYYASLLRTADMFNDLENGRFFSASEYKGETLKKIPGVFRTGLRNAREITGGIRKSLIDVRDWYTAEDNGMFSKATVDGELAAEDGRIIYDDDVAAFLEEICDGEGGLSLVELKKLNVIASYFLKVNERYKRVFKDGKWVDAEKASKNQIDIMRDARNNRTFVTDSLQNGYMRQFADPATLARAADGYDENGFFSAWHEDMRTAATNIEIDKMNALRDYQAWYKDHKKWGKHLENDTVTFRGQEMPVQIAMTLYCSLKTAKSQQGLADNGYEWRQGKKNDVVSNGGLVEKKDTVKRKNKKNNKKAVQEACKTAENELWDMFSEEDRQYIQIFEKTLNDECRGWKIETDEKMKGFSLVSKDGGYYFPTVRAQVKKTVTASNYEGDRVAHLSSNKNVVEGARGSLLLEPIDTVVLRHLHNTLLYKHYAIVAENISMLLNVNVGDNVHNPVTLKSMIEKGGKKSTELLKMFEKLSKDLQGVPKGEQAEQRFMYNMIKTLRSGYAVSVLSLNPKVLLSQLTSIIASGHIFDIKSIFGGLKGLASKTAAAEVAKYCPLAELRRLDNTAVKAQSVVDKTRVVGDILMKGIGYVDSRVICAEWYMAQIQIETEKGIKRGTEENKIEAGKLLAKVILETQQNTFVTERSDAMRGGEGVRFLTMFSADSMKSIGRWFDAIGRTSVLKRKIKNCTDAAQKKVLEQELKEAKKQLAKSTSVIVTSSVYMALVAWFFRFLYDKDEEEKEEEFKNIGADIIGNMLGGMPVLRDVYSYFSEGYEMENFMISTINDVLITTKKSMDLAASAMKGEAISKQTVLSTIKNTLFAASQVLGLPVRNAYNLGSGITRRFFPSTGYKFDSFFVEKPYLSDLKKYVEEGNEDMIETITGLMLDESVGAVSDNAVRKELIELVSARYWVLPRSVGEKINYKGEEFPLTRKQKARFKELYAVGNQSAGKLVRLSLYRNADDEVKAKALEFIYDTYYYLALQEVLGIDLESKKILFAEAIDIESLAIIIAIANSLKPDTDENGKEISGSKKAKVQKYVNSLSLSAAEKYIIMGYLGYRNKNGEEQVRSYINRLNLTKDEKEELLEYCGYTA